MVSWFGLVATGAELVDECSITFLKGFEPPTRALNPTEVPRFEEIPNPVEPPYVLRQRATVGS